MPQEIIPIRLAMVNCYLIKNDDDYLMIDTGVGLQRGTVEKALSQAGCRRGNLKLIIITHGDPDHTGNALYMKENYGARIGIHREEAPAVEKGDMRLNRKRLQEKSSFLTRLIFRLPVARLGKANRFKPDIYLEDGQELTEYGCDGKIVHLPGHSRGSIGVLTADGDLFCGDLLINNGKGKPGRNSLVDIAEEMTTSIERVKGLGVRMFYPGHGKPFPMEELV